MDVSELNLDATLATALSRANIATVSDILTTPPFELNQELKLSVENFDKLVKIACQALLKKTPVSAFELMSRSGGSSVPKLATGCSVLDRFLSGGLRRRGVNEICGVSGGGKTQLCLQLSLTAQTPVERGGLGGAVAYLCTEGAFPIRRLNQIIQERSRLLLEPRKSSGNFTDQLFIECLADMEALERCLEIRIPILVRNHDVRLVLVDSVAALFRCEYDLSDATKRARKLYSIGVLLARLNALHGTVIVCVNQVTGVVPEHPEMESSVVTPSLGLAWSNVITTRLMISRPPAMLVQPTDDGHSTNTAIIRRTLKVVFSPNLEPKSCDFYVDSSGVHGLEDSQQMESATNS